MSAKGAALPTGFARVLSDVPVRQYVLSRVKRDL
jgi:hypothetical protein